MSLRNLFIFFVIFRLDSVQKGFSLGKENPKKNEDCIKLVRRFLWKKPKAKREQGQGQRGDDATRIVTSRAAL